MKRLAAEAAIGAGVTLRASLRAALVATAVVGAAWRRRHGGGRGRGQGAATSNDRPGCDRGAEAAREVLVTARCLGPSVAPCGIKLEGTVLWAGCDGASAALSCELEAR
mmetsp:Transcript_108836/g.347418  ORF Transcript_108836/g.347418 Transcript_108836/m.347418 type:complete len:109 (+) Transcript_108836:906-1232(+)